MPDNYKFGEVSTPGLELTRNKDNLFFHMNWRANQMRMPVATENDCPSMMVLGCKRGLLSFDPENKAAIKNQKDKHPEKFVKPATTFVKFSVKQLLDLAPQLFHCADTRWKVNLPKANQLPSMRPPVRAYPCNRPGSANSSLASPSTTG